VKPMVTPSRRSNRQPQAALVNGPASQASVMLPP
jgi:hypothetical protein